MAERCRACLMAVDSDAKDLLSGQPPLRIYFSICTGLQFNADDGFPTSICSKCSLELIAAHQFRKKCEASETVLRNNILLLQKTKFTPKLITEKKRNVTQKVPKKVTAHKETPINENDKIESNDNEDPLDYSVIKSEKPQIESTDESGTDTAFVEPIILLDENIADKNKSKKRTFKSSQRHQCSMCGKSFLFRWNLVNHERVHTGDKPYQCKICDRTFTQLAHLNVHERTHTGVKPYQCVQCPKAFSISASLKKHLRIHTGEKPFSCLICGKSFRTNYHLSNHHKRHVGDKKIKCDWLECDQYFINISEMKSHRIRHEKAKFSKKKHIVELDND